MDEERTGWPSGRTTVWAGLLAILVIGGVGGLLFWAGTSLGLPRAIAMPTGAALGYFTSRTLLRAIWQRQAEQPA